MIGYSRIGKKELSTFADGKLVYDPCKDESLYGVPHDAPYKRRLTKIITVTTKEEADRLMSEGWSVVTDSDFGSGGEV